MANSTSIHTAAMKTTLHQIAQSIQGLETGLLAMALVALSISGTTDSEKESDFSSTARAMRPALVVLIQPETDRPESASSHLEEKVADEHPEFPESDYEHF
jgi:hypothetical protein